MSKPRTLLFVHAPGTVNADVALGLLPRLTAATHRLSWPLHGVPLALDVRDTSSLDGLARQFDQRLRTAFPDLLIDGGRFACVTDTVAGPILREWWRTLAPRGIAGHSPLSHLVMLAPANSGFVPDAGRGRPGRTGGTTDGWTAPDWLHLGSAELWDLNRAWARRGRDAHPAAGGTFPFVVAAQTPASPGSDGAVRIASANLNMTYLRLVQEPVDASLSRLVARRLAAAPPTAFKLLSGERSSGSAADGAVVAAILRCLAVDTPAAYRDLTDTFVAENDAAQANERVSVHRRRLFADAEQIVDPHAMVIVRLHDDEHDRAVGYDLRLDAVPAASPDGEEPSSVLLQGMLVDRHRNTRHPGTIAFYLNDALMNGSPAIVSPTTGAVLRPAAGGVDSLRLHLTPRSHEGPEARLQTELTVDAGTLRRVVRPNQTTMVEVLTRRLTREGVLEVPHARSDAHGFPGGPGPRRLVD